MCIYLKTHLEEFSLAATSVDGGEFLIYLQSGALSRPRTRTMNGENHTYQRISRLGHSHLYKTVEAVIGLTSLKKCVKIRFNLWGTGSLDLGTL